MIKVSGLTKDYGDRRAVDGLTFEVQKGEIIGFLGPNGAGKTTTMRMLTGYMPPSDGTAEIAGYDVVKQSLEVRKRVGYLPETVPLYTDMTIYDYLKFMADLRHIAKPHEVIEDTLEMVGLLDRATSFIGHLSKGMRQRVGLAQALIHKPDVLILDEPTIGLDPAQILEVRNVIREVGKEHTVMLSTHILTEAQQMCDRILIINKGKIVAEDSPENLQHNLQGGNRLELKVKGNIPALAEKIGAIKGVKKVQSKEDGLELQYGERDIRPEIARLVVESKYDLLEMRNITLSLEDIFLQLVGAEQPKAKEE